MPSEARGYLLSPLAERDLEDIWRYTYRTWSREQADRYHAAILDAIEGLASGERIGRDARDIREGYWKYAVRRHVLFYRGGSGHLTVIRILHQQMDIPSQLGASDLSTPSDN